MALRPHFLIHYPAQMDRVLHPFFFRLVHDSAKVYIKIVQNKPCNAPTRTHARAVCSKRIYLCLVAMNKKLKAALTVAGLFVGVRAYKLWQLFNGIQYTFKHVRFTRPTSNLATKYEMTVTYRIFNPTGTSMQVSNMYGTVSMQDTQVAGYATGPFVIKPGEQTLDVKIVMNPTFVVQTLLPAIASRNFPILDMTMTVRIPIGLSTTQRFKIHTRDYVPDPVAQLFQRSNQNVFK